MGDTQFHFRTRFSLKKLSSCVYTDYNDECLSPLQVRFHSFRRYFDHTLLISSLFLTLFLSLKADPSYSYGFVYFRQVKDRSARRGYFQNLWFY